MSEGTENKKIRISMVAKDINISSDSLIDFLKKKGFQVNSLNSLVSDEMMAEVTAHYKKDIEKAEKHQKKITELTKRISEQSDKDEISATIDENSESTRVSITKKEKHQKTDGSIDKPVEAVEETTPENVELETEAKPEQELEQTTELTEDVEAPEIEQPAIEVAEPEVEKVEVPEMPPAFPDQPESNLDENGDRKPKGLTVLGKMDLTPKPPVAPKPVEPAAEVAGDKPAAPKTEDAAAEEAKKKKKKKKKNKKKDVPLTPDEIENLKKKPKVKKVEIDQKDVLESIRKTVLSMDDVGPSSRQVNKKKKKQQRIEHEERLQEIRAQEEKVIKVNEYIAANELANLMGVPVGDVIKKCIELGLMVSINQRLDLDTITLVADEFDFEIELQQEYTADALADTPDDPETLQPRSPVVTIMGHVDHGKTSLLDRIRDSNVVAGEAGGITQHIGAYKVKVGDGKYIAFLDTPGHEAFTAMRARGAQVTDIVVLIVAADDSVMPQTVEAINHAQAANVPIVVAINKIDKPESNIERIRQQLADRNILVEEWGGTYQSVEISAKKGINIDLLLEKILIQAEFLDLKANQERLARGIVIEAELDKGRGVTATVLNQKGTIRIGDPFVCGIYQGRVRAMFDERGNKVSEAGPSTPVLVLGSEGVPQAGDQFIVVSSEREAREVASVRQQLKREQDNKQVHHLTLDEISKRIAIGGVKELPIIVKGDVDGSVEALSDSLMRLSTEEVVVRVIHRGVGAISESDVLLADASKAIIIGFHVRPNQNARKLAETTKVEIRIYSIIYDAINDVKSALEGLLSPIISEEIVSTIEVRAIFRVPKVGVVAGCYVLDGKVMRAHKIRVVRDGVVIFTGEINQLKRIKDDVREVDAGYECGISIVNFNDLKESDILETFKIVETKKKL